MGFIVFFIDNTTPCARCGETFEPEDKPVVFDCSNNCVPRYHQHVLHEKCFTPEELEEYRRTQRIIAGVNGLN